MAAFDGGAPAPTEGGGDLPAVRRRLAREGRELAGSFAAGHRPLAQLEPALALAGIVAVVIVDHDVEFCLRTGLIRLQQGRSPVGHDLHFEWRWRGIQARVLWVDVAVDQVPLLNDFQQYTGDESVGEAMGGAYFQLGYDVLATAKTQQALIPFIRLETYDTQKKVPAGFSRNPANDVDVSTFGVSYLPIPNIVLKLEYQDVSNAAGTGLDQWNMAVGWLF